MERTLGLGRQGDGHGNEDVRAHLARGNGAARPLLRLGSPHLFDVCFETRAAVLLGARFHVRRAMIGVQIFAQIVQNQLVRLVVEFAHTLLFDHPDKGFVPGLTAEPLLGDKPNRVTGAAVAVNLVSS